MNPIVWNYVSYFLKLLLLTLGTVAVCGFAVRLCAMLFSKLLGHGGGTVFDITSVIGTPVHELGHAAMCLLFCHRITDICLWSPTAKNGVYGYVEHSYNRKNAWARLGSLFIGVGPIFSGLGVTVLALWLCFPNQWENYLTVTRTLSADGTTAKDLADGIFSLFRSLPAVFGSDWLRATLGLIVILPVSLHISLSWADVKGSASAMPFYLAITALFALVTLLLRLDGTITSWLWLLNLRVLSLFCLVIAFAAVWVAIGLLIRLVRLIISWF